MIALFQTIWAIEIFHLRILFAFKTSLYSYYQGRVCKNVIRKDAVAKTLIIFMNTLKPIINHGFSNI